MKLTSNLRLRFSKRTNVVSVTSRTYEKASFDQFLAASIAERCSSKKSGEEYIDLVTGKGSMNGHLKKLTAEMRDNKTSKDRKAILDSSLYPIEKIDESNSFTFFPEFGVSLFDGAIYSGDLAEQAEYLEKIIPFEGELVSLKVRPAKEETTTDNYRVTIDGDEASIQIAPNAFLKANSDTFTNMVVQDIEVSNFIHSLATPIQDGEGWFLLTNSQINGPMKSDYGFVNDKAFYLITQTGLKKIEVGVAFGLFLYRETLIPYNPEHSALCDAAAKHLLASRRINEFKTKSLVEILFSTSGDVAQQCLNFVLSIKDSRELAQAAVALLSQGLKKGWSANALKQMKLVANSRQSEIVYSIAPELFDMNDVLTMDPEILTPEHRKAVEEHKKERQTKIDFIKVVNGEVSSSAIREKSGKLKNDEQVREFRQLINKLIAHSKQDVYEMDDDRLDSAFRLAKRLQGLMPVIRAKIAQEGVQ